MSASPLTGSSLSLRRPLTAWEWRLLALLVTVFFLRSLPWRLDDYDQAKQAFTSLEMVQGGAWGFQHTPGGRAVATKPPLIGWAAAAIHGLSGSWEWAWRLPSLLAAGGLVVVLWREGERLLAGFGGTLAAGAFGFNLLTPRLSLLVRTDLPLCLWSTLLGLAVARHLRGGGRPWTRRDRWTVCALLSAAMLTKGPVVYAFLLPGLAVWSGLTYRRGGRWQDAWGGWWHWTLPLLPFLLWLVRGMVTMPGFYQQVVVHEFLGRFTAGEEAVHRPGPVWSYFWDLLSHWVPWSVLLVAVRFRANRVWGSLCRDPETLWLICWAAGGLVLMSLVPSKRIDRIYPVVPPLCLVLTALVARARQPVDGTPEAPSPHWPLDWAKLALVVAAVIPAVDDCKNLGEIYLHHSNTAASFGGQVRTLTAGRRVEMVVGLKGVVGEEAMIVYLRGLRFLTPGEADRLARAGLLDAVVINERSLDYARGLLGAFHPDNPRLTSGPTGKDQSRYLLLDAAVVPERKTAAGAADPAASPRAKKLRPPSTRMP